MFGFLRGSIEREQYRQVYARYCSFQKKTHGLLALPWVSYESLFLYALAIDLELIAGPRADDPRCCRMRAKRHQWTDAERKGAEFASQFSMLLAQTKLDDDWKDQRSPTAAALKWSLRKRFVAMREYFVGIDPLFFSTIDDCFREHEQLERQSTPASIQQYVLPTSQAFGHVFESISGPLELTREHTTFALLNPIGQHIGAALIAFDCVVDWESDRRTGQYNPLRNKTQRINSLDFAISQLSAAGWKITEHTSRKGLTAGILRYRIDSLAQRRRRIEERHFEVRKPARRSLLARAGFCDCDCLVDACCHGTPDCHSCDVCCPCECLCVESCQSKAKKGDPTLPTQTGIDATTSKYIGSTAIVQSPLQPHGTILIDGEELPAKSELGHVNGQAKVTIVRQESFGYVVRPIGLD